jgi:hypothetical protein
MSLFNLKRAAITAASALLFVAFAGSSEEANGQNRRDIQRERQRIEREQRRVANQRQANRDYRIIRRAENAHYDHGYAQGLLAGQYDRRRGKFNQSNVYRGTGSYPNSGDPTSTDYIYRQGYLQGYNNGFYGPRNY